jgi:hypothetical protein
MCNALYPTPARPDKKPDDQANDRQQQNQKNPQQLADIAGAGLEYVDNGPDVGGQDQQTEQAPYLNIHIALPLLLLTLVVLTLVVLTLVVLTLVVVA